MANEPIVPPVVPPATPGTPPPDTITRAEHITLLEAARTEEKKKLHAEIQTLNAKLEDSSKLSVAQTQLLEAKLRDAETQLATLSKAKTSAGEIDVRQVIKETTDAARSSVASEKDAELGALRARLDQVEKENQQGKLNALKRELVAAAGGRIIAALVTGSTEAELRASADEAKREYEVIASQYKAAAPGPDGKPALPPPAPGTPTGGAGQPPANGIETYIRQRGDMKTFGQKREALQAELKAKFG